MTQALTHALYVVATRSAAGALPHLHGVCAEQQPWRRVQHTLRAMQGDGHSRQQLRWGHRRCMHACCQLSPTPHTSRPSMRTQVPESLSQRVLVVLVVSHKWASTDPQSLHMGRGLAASPPSGTRTTRIIRRSSRTGGDPIERRVPGPPRAPDTATTVTTATNRPIAQSPPCILLIGVLVAKNGKQAHPPPVVARGCPTRLAAQPHNRCPCQAGLRCVATNAAARRRQRAACARPGAAGVPRSSRRAAARCGRRARLCRLLGHRSGSNTGWRW